MRFLSELRQESHRLDIEAARERGERAAEIELRRSAGEYSSRGSSLGCASGGRRGSGRGISGPAAALRELLALQSSDWAFLLTTGEYPRERFAEHEALMDAALAGESLPEELRNLAPWLGSWPV